MLGAGQERSGKRAGRRGGCESEQPWFSKTPVHPSHYPRLRRDRLRSCGEGCEGCDSRENHICRAAPGSTQEPLTFCWCRAALFPKRQSKRIWPGPAACCCCVTLGILLHLSGLSLHLHKEVGRTSYLSKVPPALGFYDGLPCFFQPGHFLQIKPAGM